MVKSSVFIVFLTACASSPPPLVDVPSPDLTIPPLGKGPSPPPAVAERGEQCHLTLEASRIQKSSEGCYLIESISKSSGVLSYPCKGDGVAEAVFGEERFTGRMSGFELDLEAKNELDYEGDRCLWGMTATIRGGPVGSASARLVWSYSDYVLRGEHCSGACTAHATFNDRDTR